MPAYRTEDKHGNPIEDGEIPRGTSLSGNNYVSVRLRDSSNRPGPVLLRAPMHCNHGVTMCNECAHSWLWDYQILWSRTGGGRKLRETYIPEKGKARE